MTARIVSLNLSKGGVPKLPVAEARATVNGIEGDKQRDRRFHGGPTRAVSLYSRELIDALAAEGHPIEPGSIGENVTLSGVDWSLMQPGARVRLGEVEVELTSYAAPCKTIRGSFASDEFTRISQKARPGWSRLYARVLKEGVLRVNDPVEVVE